jgi:hypothetical protein
MRYIQFIERCGRVGRTINLYLRAPGFKFRRVPQMSWLSLLQSFQKNAENTSPLRPRPLLSTSFLTRSSPINLPLYAIWFKVLKASLNKQTFRIIQYHQETVTAGKNDRTTVARTLKQIQSFISMSLKSSKLRWRCDLHLRYQMTAVKQIFLNDDHSRISDWRFSQFSFLLSILNLTRIKEGPNIFHIHAGHQ